MRIQTSFSELIRLAVSDARRIDRGVYVANWVPWHTPTFGGPEKCGVCLAGMVIAGTCGIDPSKEAAYDSPELFLWKDLLLALNAIRAGNYDAAHQSIYGSGEPVPVFRLASSCPGFRILHELVRT